MISLNPTAGTLLLAAVLAASAMAACSGPSDQLLSGAPSPGNLASSTDTNAPTNPAGDVGNVTLHRLNASEYDNTVRDLLGDTSHPSATFPPDDGADSFTNNADALSISPILFEKYEANAEKLATTAVTNPKIMTCDGTSTGGRRMRQADPHAVLETRLEARGDARRGGRPRIARPGGGAGGTTLHSGDAARDQGGAAVSQFHIQGRAGPESNCRFVTPAERLRVCQSSLVFLWSSMPDDALFASAESGKLSKDVPELDAQVGRMLDDPKAQALLDNFASQWLMHTLPNAKPDATMFPGFDEGLRAAMAAETKALHRVVPDRATRPFPTCSTRPSRS